MVGKRKYASRRPMWDADDWLKMAVGAADLIKTRGMNQVDAFVTAQAVMLEPDKRRDDAKKTFWKHGPKMAQYLGLAAKMTDRDREKYLSRHAPVDPPPPAPRKPGTGSAKGRHIVRWTDSECAQVGYEFLAVLQETPHIKWIDAALKAQARALSPDRCLKRPTFGIMGHLKFRDRINAAMQKVPPVKRTTASAAKAILAGNPPAAPIAAPVPAPQPIAEIAPAAASVAPAPMLPATALEEFGLTMMSALERFMQSQPVPPAPQVTLSGPSSEEIATLVEQRVREQVQTIEDRVAQRMLFAIDEMSTKIQAAIEGSMRSAIRSVLLEELGGTSDPKAPAPETAPPPVIEQTAEVVEIAPRRKHNPEMVSEGRERIPKVDIVGLLSIQAVEVRNRLKDLEGRADIRFIDKDKENAWTPREIVVLVTRFVSHTHDERARKAGARIVLERGGPLQTEGTVRLAVQQWEEDQRNSARTQKWQRRARG